MHLTVRQSCMHICVTNLTYYVQSAICMQLRAQISVVCFTMAFLLGVSVVLLHANYTLSRNKSIMFRPKCLREHAECAQPGWMMELDFLFRFEEWQGFFSVCPNAEAILLQWNAPTLYVCARRKFWWFFTIWNCQIMRCWLHILIPLAISMLGSIF